MSTAILASLLFASTALTACGGGGSSADGVTVSKTTSDGKKLSADDKAAADAFLAKLQEHWVKAPDGWITEYQQYNMLGQVMPGQVPDLHFHQFREFKFTVTPEELTDAMKLNGTDYRGSVKFEGCPERYYREEQTWEGPKGWGQWKDGNPEWAGLAIERRKGQWITSDSDLFRGVKPNSATIPPG